MRKIFSLFVVWLMAIVCSAQIQVANTGNVGIGDTLTTDMLIQASKIWRRMIILAL